jgi:hypothetical protein
VAAVQTNKTARCPLDIYPRIITTPSSHTSLDNSSNHIPQASLHSLFFSSPSLLPTQSKKAITSQQHCPLPTAYEMALGSRVAAVSSMSILECLAALLVAVWLAGSTANFGGAAAATTAVTSLLLPYMAALALANWFGFKRFVTHLVSAGLLWRC